MRTLLIEKYLDYVNNYMSFDVFAEHNGISRDFAVELVAEGRRLHEEDRAIFIGKDFFTDITK